VFGASTVAGRLATKTGKVKPYIVFGTVVLTAGFGMLATIDHTTSLVFLGVGMFLIGVGVGMTMQNLVLVVQNSVRLDEIGAASGTVTFFRSLGGTIGVSVLGAILAAQVADKIADGLRRLGVDPTAGGGDAGNLDLAALPAPVREIVRAAYGDATGHIFLVSAGIAVVGIIAAALLKPVRLRDSLDLVETPEPDDPVPAVKGGSLSGS
jgi:MFS family permease